MQKTIWKWCPKKHLMKSQFLTQFLQLLNRLVKVIVTCTVVLNDNR